MRETLPAWASGRNRASAFSGADAAVLSVAIVWGASYPVAKVALAFAISLCTLLTPLLDHALARTLPPPGIVTGACLSCAGVAVLSGGLSSLGSGDALMLAAAALRACMVVATQRVMAGRKLSSTALTSVQAAVVGAVRSPSCWPPIMRAPCCLRDSISGSP